MSYNNQFSYSPYFQGANQNGRAQVSYPNNSTEAGSYRRQSHSYPQPQSYPSSPQTSSESAPNAYAPPKHGYLRPPSNGDYDNTKAKNQVVGMNTYQNARKPIDTTALGNLAYASSLGQNSPDHSATGLDNSSLQQVSDYNHSQTTANYSEPSPYPLSATAPATNRYEFPRPDNYEAGNRRESIESRDSSSMHQAHYASYSADGEQKDQQDQVHSRLPQVHPNYPSRPSSGQSIRTVQRSNPHSTLTSLSSNNPSYTTTSAKRVNNHVYESDPSMTSLPQASNPANKVTTSARDRSSISQSKDEVHQNVSKQSIIRTSSASDRQTNHQTNNQETQSRNDKSSTIGSRDDELNDTVQANDQHPVTVDPNQIFNHQEYQRRQAAAAAAAAARRTDQVLERKTDATKASASVGDASTKEQMELEMKQMIDKMREYKAKDPNLFLHIWEQVKKGVPANQASPQPQPSAGPSTETPAPVPKPTEKVQAPRQNDVPLQPERPAEQLHNEPDLGKFPAQRRKKKYIKEPLGKSSSPAIQMAEKPPASVDKTPNRVTQPTPLAPNTNGSSISHHGFQPMQKAMKDFNRNLNLQERSDSEVVYAKGVGPPKRTGGTIWPQRDKRLLANTGMKALMSDARNADKNISAEEIIRYLDQNVSYQDLCEILESKDLVFDRGSLARTLLSATSADRNTTIRRETDIVKPVSEVTNHVEVMDNVNNHMGLVDSVDNHVEVMNSVNNHTEVVNSANNHNEVINQNKIEKRPDKMSQPKGKSGRNIKPLPTSKHFQTHIFSAKMDSGTSRFQHHTSFPSSTTNPPQVQHHPVLPPSKKEMARKRSFGELIDLTQEISDDDLPPQAQKARLSESFTVKATSDSTTEHPTVRPSSPNTVFEDDLRKKLLQNLGRVENKADRSSPTATDQYTPSQYDLMNFESIISQMNEKVDALRRSRYEPKTIARDILIAAGKHPSMIPLNYHLDNLRKKFRYVDYKSDLSTFRWDLVDPGGPKPGASDEKQGHTINQPIKAQQHSWKSQPPNSQGQTESNQVQEGLDPSQNDFVEENLMSFFHDDPDPVATPDQPHKKRRGRPSGSGRKPINGITGKSNAVVKTPEQKRRGRPVGSRNRTSDVSRSKMVTQRRSLPSGSIPMRSSGLKNAETPSEGFAVLIGSGTEM